MNEDFSLDLRSLHAAYDAGTLTPESLIRELYARMERTPTPNAWIARVPEAEALARARALGPRKQDDPRRLYGVPFAVKDNIDVAGLPTTAACPAFAYLPTRSASAVQALLDAGALCLGKLNLDQFATGLVGTRSPYGACENVFDAAYLSGGSSSGSAVVVAAHHVSFSLGTDTAGSGRVPAALNNVVGLKPSLGLLPRDGMVPACASLDCLSLFALSVDDAACVRDVILGRPHRVTPRPASFRYGVPRPLELFDDRASAHSFARALTALSRLGGEPVELDFAPFSALGDLLYGPFVVERLLAVGAFVAAHEREVLPLTRDIILGARGFDASDAFRAFQRVNELRAACLRELEQVDVLVTPTVPTHFRRDQERAEPRAINDQLGIYTRFVNFVGCPALAVPADFREDGLPFGVSLLAKPGRDLWLDGLAGALHAASDAGMGRARHPLPRPIHDATGASPASDVAIDATSARPSVRLALDDARPLPIEARLAVVGAHLRGMPLNAQLLAVEARYVATVRTAPEYRLYALAAGPPERPGLVRVASAGAAIEVELWDLTWAALGAFMANVPAPLAIGTLQLADGELVKGFVCEASATEGARDISHFGGFRAYLAARA